MADRAAAPGVVETSRSPAPAAPSPPILLEARDGAVAVLTLNRPAQRNSLSEALIVALEGAVQQLSGDAGVKAIVIGHAGPAFSAGHDMKEMTARRADPDRGRAYFAHLMQRCAGMMLTVLRSPKPVIAAVEGVASAAGCQLVATCDLAVAGAGARFATPGVDIGLFCSTPMVALSRNVPRKRAMEMLLLGEMIDAGRAADWGLVNRVVAAGSADAEAMRLARVIASKSPATIAIGKRAYYDQIEAGLEQAYIQCAEVMVTNMLLRDAEEGIGAFIEKRKPEWQGC